MMKLEEVLPAMRAGRVAIDVNGSRWRLIDERFQVSGPSSPPNFIDSGPWITEGWTLEPEPKVEWPKGSLQWVHGQAERTTSLIRRKGQTWTVAVGAIDRTHIGWDSFFALDWEVVP